MPFEIRQTSDGLTFAILVVPRASKNEVAGRHGDALKVRLTAPPVEGRANKMCLAFLAKQLGVPKSAVEIVSGLTGRSKKVKVRWPEGEMGAEERAKLRRTVMDLAVYKKR